MRRNRLWAVFVVSMALSLITATPVIACEEEQPFGGEQVMALNADLETEENLYGCEAISWFGTIELSGTTYGMALYPLADGYVDDTGLYHYTERWRIFSGTFSVKDGSLERCYPGLLLAEGRDNGTWNMETGYFMSQSSPDYVAQQFRSWWGKTVKQDGYAPQPVSVAGLEGVPGLMGNLWLDQ